jgi:hypothetical protein
MGLFSMTPFPEQLPRVKLKYIFVNEKMKGFKCGSRKKLHWRTF